MDKMVKLSFFVFLLMFNFEQKTCPDFLKCSCLVRLYEYFFEHNLKRAPDSISDEALVRHNIKNGVVVNINPSCYKRKESKRNPGFDTHHVVHIADVVLQSSKISYDLELLPTISRKSSQESISTDDSTLDLVTSSNFFRDRSPNHCSSRAVQSSFSPPIVSRTQSPINSSQNSLKGWDRCDL